jgi:hypothetical protein
VVSHKQFNHLEVRLYSGRDGLLAAEFFQLSDSELSSCLLLGLALFNVFKSLGIGATPLAQLTDEAVLLEL